MTSINSIIMLCILMDMNVDTDKPKVIKKITQNSNHNDPKHNEKRSFKHTIPKHAATHKTYKSKK